MNIAHIGGTSGVPISLANEQLRQGHKAKVFVFSPLAHEQFGGTFVDFNKVSIWKGKIHMNPFYFWHRFKFFQAIKEFDIWHYHAPYGKLKEKLEQEKKGRRYIKHYHGTDLRHKYDEDFCLVSTPDLLQFARNAVWLPNPLDLDFLSRFRDNNKRENDRKIMRLAHYSFYKNPGHNSGYDYYVDALNHVQHSGKSIMIEIYNLPYPKAIEKHSVCDITIGKIVPDIGWMGRFELEGMALGKPVICYILDELYDKYKPPVFRTTRETFKHDLEYLIEDETTRRRLAKEGPEYVQKNHDVKAIVERLEDYYKKL